MEISLSKFEHIIDETILKRGLDYFKKGAVSDFSEISNGEYEALVSGSDEYTVRLKVENYVIVEHDCDCPYDLGPVCKHKVAVIFYLVQDELGLNEPTPKRSKKTETQKRTPKTKSSGLEVIDLLKQISHEELIEFVAESCKTDKKIRNQFLVSFGHLSQDQSKRFYQKQIHSILQAAKNRDGWIGRSDMIYVMNTAMPFLQMANQFFQQGKFEYVLFISAALLEEMTKAIQYGDDSNGELGFFIESAKDLLLRLAQEELSPSFKKEMFQYCVKAFQSNIFKGWDWHLGMLQIAGSLVKNETEAEIIMHCLDSVEGEYNKEAAQSYKLELLRQYKDPSEVEEFINNNLTNSIIRNEEITKAFENHNFERAIKLAKDGIAMDQKDKPGLAVDWYDWLLEIALVQKDTPSIIRYARYRFMRSFRAKHDYYQILKQNIEPENWDSFLEEIIKEETPKQRWTYSDLIRQIYIREEWWDRLLLMLKQNLSLENIQRNEEYLAKDYAEQLIELYAERIPNYVDKFIGRKHYQTACRYMRRMKKLGGNKRVNELIELLRSQHPKRVALMDELNRV
jgi:polyhydroxyalkanoate synthesis regulator phasin